MPLSSQSDLFSEPVAAAPYRVSITLDYAQAQIVLVWLDARSSQQAGEAHIRCTGLQELTWELKTGSTVSAQSGTPRASVTGAILTYIIILP